MRINKYIANCGISSRRGAELLIKENRVKLNNKIVSDLATEVNENNDTVSIDGNKIELVTKSIYIMLNKPKGCVCTKKDERGRKTIMDYVKLTDDKGVFHIGRLDYNSEGLILLTNDGELAQKITHPSHEIPKTYIAKIKGNIPENDLAMLRNGVVLDNSKTHPCKIKLLEKDKDDICRYEVTIYEGRNRQIRRMFEMINKEVVFLKRIAIGELRLGGLGRGLSRYLTEREINILKSM
ncbi:MAG: rRNA pseudouridine synthase [Christensenellaceae bacterium]|jgi:23S rRNA pseudouridine2605 synthase|nr:rRNA pseudouridine synthase [Christensenellaceae bacterium]